MEHKKMTVSIVKNSTDSITLQVTVPFNRSMMDSENAIQKALNDVGSVATSELLKKFDTDGSPIIMGNVKMTSMGLISKCYQTPYGEIVIDRNIYQTSKGGKIFCPLEKEARIVLTSTPKFASQVSHKMAEMAGGQVRDDLSINHSRDVTLSLIQRLSEAVAAVVQAKEEAWSYHVPELKDTEVKTISIGLDGTCMLMSEEGYRQAMVGTISLYDKDGERQHTTYIAAAPEYGKEKFKERLVREIERTKTLYPTALQVGIADGAHDNWDFLEKYTDKQILDFYHATEYLTSVADDIFSSSIERKNWLDDRCYQLKHIPRAAEFLLNEMEGFLEKELSYSKKQDMINPSREAERFSIKNTSKKREKKKKSLDTAITYFKNNIEKSRMDYAENIAANQPIGSGVTEAACKTIVKQRLCKSGMRWKNKGASVILSIRTLVKSTGRWEQFWAKVNQYGFPIAA